jgi:LuxR family maltose regulon positive regulatory protein
MRSDPWHKGNWTLLATEPGPDTNLHLPIRGHIHDPSPLSIDITKSDDFTDSDGRPVLHEGERKVYRVTVGSISTVDRGVSNSLVGQRLARNGKAWEVLPILVDDQNQARQTPTLSDLWSALASSDAEDNELARFFSYLIAALATVAPGTGEAVGNLLRLPQLPPSETILTTLLNELCSLPTDLVLVLEDYHTIEARAIHGALTFLLDNLPLQVHLVISTRADPPLPLSRWRSRGMMVEIHADDLRFTRQESMDYLNDVMSLHLVPEDVTALTHRTEGWIVGLQMAALALKGKSMQQDASAFVQAFSGSHHYILDYLVEEVLAYQSDTVQTFLLQTSILSRLTGPLCDAVRFGSAESPNRSEGAASSAGTAGPSRADGQEMLEALDAANLFLVPLDDERR